MRQIQATFGLVDPTNPSIGFGVLVSDAVTGKRIYRSSIHPVTGKDLLNEHECIEVISYYLTPRT